MDGVSPEILHIICSFLSIDDVLNFRLVCRPFSDIGAAYMLPDLTLYIHDEDLSRLRAISLHPIFSRNVRSLTYFAQALDCPKVSYYDFVADHRRDERWNSKLRKMNLSNAQLREEYAKYAIAADRQKAIMDTKLDIAVLKEVLPKFTRLQHMTMSADNEFFEGRIPRKKRYNPLEKILRWYNHTFLGHEGVRHLEALLSANADAKCALKSLRAGTLHWSFFRKSAEEIARLFNPLSNLQAVEFIINVDLGHVKFSSDAMDANNAVDRCRRVMAKGALKKAFQSMPRLRSLCVEFVSMSGEDLYKGATLKHLIDPGFQWPHLRDLAMGGIETDRQELMEVLELHKGTLQRLCLRDVYLKSTSWKKLLPDIRRSLCLVDACICGNLYGHVEDGEEAGAPPHEMHWLESDIEYWELSVPELGDHEMRNSINIYCRCGGELYPDELPDSEEVVEKNYDYVRGFFDESDEDHGTDSEFSVFGYMTDLSGADEESDSDDESNSDDESDSDVAIGMVESDDESDSDVAIGMVESDDEDDGDVPF